MRLVADSRPASVAVTDSRYQPGRVHLTSVTLAAFERLTENVGGGALSGRCEAVHV